MKANTFRIAARLPTLFRTMVGTLLLSVACDSPKENGSTNKVQTTAQSATRPSATAALPLPSATVAPKKDVVCPSPPAVNVTMPGLEAELRRKVGKDGGALTTDDLAKVKSLNLTAPGIPVDDLDPCIFPHLKNVKDIFLGRGTLHDLKPLATLTQLMTLRVADTQVADLSPLEHLSHMDRLDISKTAVTDLSVVRNMPDLTELSLDGTHVTDLAPLAGLKKLEKLSIKETLVRDLSPLRELRSLRMLWVAGSSVDSTNVLDPLKAKGLKILIQ